MVSHDIGKNTDKREEIGSRLAEHMPHGSTSAASLDAITCGRSSRKTNTLPRSGRSFRRQIERDAIFRVQMHDEFAYRWSASAGQPLVVRAVFPGQPWWWCKVLRHAAAEPRCSRLAGCSVGSLLMFPTWLRLQATVQTSFPSNELYDRLARKQTCSPDQSWLEFHGTRMT